MLDKLIQRSDELRQKISDGNVALEELTENFSSLDLEDVLEKAFHLGLAVPAWERRLAAIERRIAFFEQEH